MMSYIDLNWDFSQFDRDNSARHHAAGYALIANRASPRLRRQAGRRLVLVQADGQLAAAKAALAAHDYAGDAEPRRRRRTVTSSPGRRRRASLSVHQPATWTIVRPSRTGTAGTPSSERARGTSTTATNVKRFAPVDTRPVVGSPGARRPPPSPSSHVEADVEDVAVLDDVGLALEALCPRLRPRHGSPRRGRRRPGSPRSG